ncbi:Coiled stalk of trimeric autotransporter adhesin [uncultured Caudovirales phage]|uniref:Coiled stalk of trimeric autotransporter adhesin n=1 Tax=uncultured Caudovirales phage TaxID=2100421 RepID=A0A6J5PGB0_9CAUD|nr:Coiled stalk of trimeric autotransporter adhesin [uncultured Caudovirales phage]
MAWSGGTYRKGNYSTNGWTGDASLGIGIEAGRHDTQDDDFQGGINQCLNKDGSNAATGNLNIGSNRLTNVSAGTARTDAINLSQVQDNSLLWGGTSGGTANAQTLTLAPIITAYVAGQRYSFIAGFTNTAAATLNINGVGTKSIFNAATGAAIGAGEIVATRAYEVLYDGTQFLLLNDVTPIQNGDYIWLGTTGGTATAQTASATPAITAYKAGQKFRAKIGASLQSTGTTATTHTLLINGITPAKNIVNQDGTNPTAGTWVAGAIIELVYDGTNFVITNDPGGWQTYSVTVTGSGGMTITSLGTRMASYRKTGKLITIMLDINFTIVAPLSNTIFLTSPVNSLISLGGTSQVAFGIPFLSNGGVGGIGQAYFATAPSISVFTNTSSSPPNWAAGSTDIRLSWSYMSV